MEIAVIAEIIVGRLESLRKEIQQQWTTPEGTKTRHFVVDELLPPDTVRAIYEAFPRNAEGFFDRASFREKKKTLTDLSQLPTILAAITYAVQHPNVVSKVAELIGFEHIQPDPSLYAGGLSMMFKGDFLNPHIDNSHGADRNLYRRLNLLYYVTPNWELKNGGNFELWDTEVKKPHIIPSVCNRLVVMETNKDSWHSVSPIIEDVIRCCVSNYYFSKQSPDNTNYFHVTSFSGRPEEKGRRVLGFFDNRLRNILSKTLRIGRNKSLVNKRP
ncbi:2OG-Fe(II) oxygenase [Pseudomonas syringae group sp. J309-1]|uniref:2OG-Fe(II) oxygenase n=1 Tax=Pseudomonas syringae group sp. J309-1 TaxID=3079588 RepID=UPI00290C2632|nr:2OG-Fe(II) oxygenase [Pseudomonas syringae group sp. J309-1]MDU8361880.1 2OG-Fe(II) oxygenase [Pseudomonas syringae group sp. J309-1]